MTIQSGVLPDDVVRDPDSEAVFIFLTLDQALDGAGVQALLAELSVAIAAFETRSPRQLGSAVLGFGRSFFQIGAEPRFGLAERTPAGLATPLASPAGDSLPSADIAIYAMSSRESKIAELMMAISRLHGQGLIAASVEWGFQREDRRELFGNLDGLRNMPWEERYRGTFVDRDSQPEEPDWAEDGSYLAYLKIRQDLDTWNGMSEEEKEQTIGRRLADGSRLDLAQGSDPRSEGDYAGEVPAENSHVRKSGPRGGHDDNKIFRRGVPYFGLGADGSAQGGLQFASFQASLRQFEVVFGDWISNPDFPRAGAGVDQLFARGLAVVERAGFFFVPPADSRYLGAGAFDPPRPDPIPRSEGRILVRKRVVDQAGNPLKADVDAVAFQVFKSDGTPVGEEFETNSGGIATSGDLPVRQDLILREVRFPDNLEPSQDTPFRLEHRRQVLDVVNKLKDGSSPYGS